MSTPFQKAWWGTDLPPVRGCDGTYCHFPYDSLPPLDETLFRGDFQWLMPLDEPTDEAMSVHRAQDTYRTRIANQLASLRASAAEAGVVLPEPFVRFMENPDAQFAIPSCTACYFHLSTRVIPSVVEEGAYLVRFYNDQQDVLLWYLYLMPTGEHYVVGSPIPFDDEEVNEPAEVVKAHTVFCAPSFEAFLYRIWLENSIWFATVEDNRTLTAAEQAYIDHYQNG